MDKNKDFCISRHKFNQRKMADSANRTAIGGINFQACISNLPDVP